MAILNILRYPDGRLHKVAAPVTVFDESLKKLVADMAETMYAAPGVGLAATQVDVHKRVIVIDVSDTKAVGAVADKIVSETGRVDVLVNNAGVTRDGLLMRMSEEDWDTVMNTNLRGAFAFTKAFSRAFLKQRSGRIINVSSVIGLIGNAGQCNYAASKAALIGLTKSVARELASRGVNCNAIAPGFIDTDMTAVLNDEARTELLKKIPLNSLGKPEDIAEAALFLAGPGARYITGQVLTVDGGMVM